MRVETLTFNEFDGSGAVSLFIRFSPGSILCGIGLKGGGDIEIQFGLEECGKIISLLQSANSLDQQIIDSGGNLNTVCYRFKNIDGGEGASISVSKMDTTIKIIVER